MDTLPTCVIVTGRPGSGKTTLAALLGARLHLPVVSRDALKEGYVHTLGLPHNALPPESNAIVSDVFFKLVRTYLEGQISIVIEAAFQHRVWAAHLAQIQEIARPVVIVCSVSGAMAAQRHLERGLVDTNREFFHGDARVAAFRNSGRMLPPDEYVAPTLGVPTVEVSTAHGYAPEMNDIVAWVQGLGADAST